MTNLVWHRQQAQENVLLFRIFMKSTVTGGLLISLRRKRVPFGTDWVMQGKGAGEARRRLRWRVLQCMLRVWRPWHGLT